MTAETVKEMNAITKAYHAGVDDALNLVAAVVKSRVKNGLGPLPSARILELIETSRENFKGK